MIVILVEVLHLIKLCQQVKDSNLDDFHTLREDLSKASSLSEGTWSLFLFRAIFSLICLWLISSDELDFQDNTIAIVDVSKTI